MPQRLLVETFCLGQWMTNCYVLHLGADRAPARPAASKGSAEAGPCWIIDAGFSPGPMIQFIKDRQLQPQQVLLTHAHVDHIAGLDDLRAVWPQLPILVHAAEAEFLTEPSLNLSIVLEEPLSAPPATGFLEHGQVLKLDTIPFEIRHSPGHTPGGIAIYQKDAGLAFVGDTLFAGSIGRTDFPGASHEQLLQSIRTQILTLPESTRILSGHGPATTVGQEKTTNPFLQF